MRLLPKSLLGQMLLAVAAVLLLAQAVSGVLLWRAQENRRDALLAQGIALRLAATPDRVPLVERGPRRGPRPPLRLEYADEFAIPAGARAEQALADRIAEALAAEGAFGAQLRAYSLETDVDRAKRPEARRRPPRLDDRPPPDAMLVVGARLPGSDRWTILRAPLPERDPRRIGVLIGQTLLLYLLLVGGLWLVLRRIVRPLADLRVRMERFAETQSPDAPLALAGPTDTRRLIAAHNAMEARIAALLDEKDVMLGAIGHDLKTPLAALRVRIESVGDEAQRARMAATIEDVTRTLDDILSLARVGRPIDEPIRTDCAALVSGVIEEFEDMGEPVELVSSERIVLPLRATWLRRALRNLIGNALRYGERARVTLWRAGDHMLITVSDEGPGIREDRLEAMLEPFARGEASRNRATGGAGLGLALARAIAQQHGGTLTLANRRGAAGEVNGLDATIALPL